MTMIDPALDSIDSYIQSFPENIQKMLQEVREAIRAAAPDARETISYRMPTYVLNGNLVHFAGYQNHIGFYPTPSGIEAFKAELVVYKTSKGAIQFPVSQPMPLDLITRITAFRVSESLQKPASRKRKS